LGLIDVREGWDKVEGAQAPKSSAGLRIVPIPEQLYELLDEHLLWIGRTSGLMFGGSATQPYSYNGVRDRASSANEDAGLKPNDLQLHKCRHSYSSWLSAAGVADSRADRYMGHADHSTPGRYRHQLDAQYLEDSNALSDYLRRADTPSRLTGAQTGSHGPETASLSEK
jgi:integrase